MIERFWVVYSHCSKKYKNVADCCRWLRRLSSVLLLVSTLVFCSVLPAQSATVEQLELAYIYKILSFVTLADSSGSEITVVILGSEKFGVDLQSFAMKKVGGKTITIKPYLTEADLDGCEVVFITEIPSADIAEILKQVEDDHCLTIGDTPDFIDQGGMIGFVFKQGRLRFEINQKVALENGILISSNLLEVASKVLK